MFLFLVCVFGMFFMGFGHFVISEGIRVLRPVH